MGHKGEETWDKGRPAHLLLERVYHFFEVLSENVPFRHGRRGVEHLVLICQLGVDPTIKPRSAPALPCRSAGTPVLAYQIVGRDVRFVMLEIKFELGNHPRQYRLRWYPFTPGLFIRLARR